jgi:hypothetical protein
LTPAESHHAIYKSEKLQQMQLLVASVVQLFGGTMLKLWRNFFDFPTAAWSRMAPADPMRRRGGRRAVVKLAQVAGAPMRPMSWDRRVAFDTMNLNRT